MHPGWMWITSLPFICIIKSLKRSKIGLLHFMSVLLRMQLVTVSLFIETCLSMLGSQLFQTCFFFRVCWVFVSGKVDQQAVPSPFFLSQVLKSAKYVNKMTGGLTTETHNHHQFWYTVDCYIGFVLFDELSQNLNCMFLYFRWGLGYAYKSTQK